MPGLRKRLDDPAVRSAETGRILPGAIKSASSKNLREALEPVFEKSFRNSVRKNPKDISDAIYPVMGPAIRSSIRAAIREFAESLNQIVEKSASWRAIRWRVEARVTGRPFTEILLTRSMLYSVEQVFLIHRESGVLLMHVAAKSVVIKDADMVSGMFTAIQDFVSDSFLESGQELETIDVGRYKLWIQYGSKALLVGAVSGIAPVELKAVFRSALEAIHATLLTQLETFNQEDLSVFEPARPYLEGCLLGQRAPDKRKRWMLWLVLGRGHRVARVAGVRTGSQCAPLGCLRRCIAAAAGHRHPARGETRIGWSDCRPQGSQSARPVSSIGGFGLDPAKVRYEWQPYLSLNTPFAVDRAIEADLEYIREQTIRFELASPNLPLAEAGHIEHLAAAIGRIHKVKPEVRFDITGHTDEIGSGEANLKLSMDRAVSVSQALAAQGVPAGLFNITGVGNSQPLRTGRSEWDQGANRSVSFRAISDALH